MDILQAMLDAQSGGAVKQLAQQFGLSDSQTSAALSALAPALATGFQQEMQSPGGLDGLLGALTGGQHSRYTEDPSTLANAAADGNGILGHIFGSKDVSRQVAARASQQTGIDPGILKQMLPLAAALMMGVMSNKSRGAAAAPAGGDLGGGLMSMLTPMLDQNRDGSMIDDVVGMLGKFAR
jgi:hypothetical protein